MAVYPTKTNELNIRKSRLKRGIILISVFSLLLIFLMFNLIPIFTISMLGTFGLLLYPLSLFMITLGIMQACNKEIVVSKKIVICLIVWLCLFTLMMQMATSKNIDNGLGEYLLTTFKSCSTAGGVLFGLVLYPLYLFTYDVATYIILAIALVITTAILIDKIYLEIVNGKKQKSNKETHAYRNEEVVQVENEEPQEPYEETASFTEEGDSEENIFIDDEESIKEEQRSTAKSLLGLSNEKFEKRDYSSNTNSYIDKLENPINDEEVEEEETEEVVTNVTSKPNIFVHEEETFTPFTSAKKTEPVVPQKTQKEIEDEERRRSALEFLNITQGKFETKNKKKGIDNVKTEEVFAEKITKTETSNIANEHKANLDRLQNMRSSLNSAENSGYSNPFKAREENQDLYDSKFTKKEFNARADEFKRDNITINSAFNAIPKKAQEVYTGEVKENIVDPVGIRPVQVSMNDPVRKPSNAPKVYKKPPVYVRPPLDLLKKYPTTIDQDQAYIEEKGNLIVETLRAFRIETKIINAVKGPTFTRFELQMAPGIPVGSINNKINDLSMALESSCRLQVPIPGKNAFGIEVPNKDRITVGLREILESSNFQKSKSPLTFALGKDIASNCKVASIDKMVHTLIAGATGSGKSVCLNTLLISLLYKASPEDLRLLLVDPKTVEFSAFNNLPHMLIPNTITECDKAVDALDWLVKEMDNRYKKLNALGVKKIDEYNETPEVISGSMPKMYYIVMVFDEVGDFMTRAKKEIEEKIRLLAAKSRACGIHLILATQRPTVDVITGTIKANLPSRIAFAVNSAIDSKTILESSGAEYLLGMGDMLYLPYGSNDMDRIQGCFVDNNELKAVINFVKENNESVYDEEIEDAMFNKRDVFDSNNSADNAFDPMLKDCLKFFIKSKKTSTTSLQTCFGIGYPKASKIIMQMEKAGFVSPGDSNGRRTLYITPQEFEEKFGEGIDEWT